MKPILPILVTAAASLASVATPGHAFNPQPDPPGSWALGVAFGQTARVQVVNAADLLGPLFPPPGDGTEGDLVCDVRLSVVGDDGETILAVDSRVEPGRTAAVELSSRELGIRQGQRTVLRGVVQFTGNTEERIRCQGTTRSSLELFDSRSGRTSLVLPIVTTFLPPDPI